MTTLIINVYLGLLDYIPNTPFLEVVGESSEEETIFLIKEWIVDTILLNPRMDNNHLMDNIHIDKMENGWKFSFDRHPFTKNDSIILDNIQKYVNGEWG